MRLLVIALLVLVASCKKSDCKEPEPKPKAPGPYNAVVAWYGEPAVDGLGWVLKLDSQKIEKPSNLSKEFQVNGLKVMVQYEPSTEKFACFCAQGFINMVRITSITKS
jgi:hypothetical protein